MAIMYVMDFGIVIDSEDKVNFFALTDKKSVEQRMLKLVDSGYEIRTLKPWIAYKCVDSFTRSRMNYYLKNYANKASDIKHDVGKHGILEIISSIPESQHKAFITVK